MENGLSLPAIAFVPPNPGSDVTLYVHGEGKEADAAPGGPIPKSLSGKGKRFSPSTCAASASSRSATSRGNPLARAGRDVATAYLLGKSYVGMRAEDILRCASLLRSSTPPFPHSPTPLRVHLVAVGEAGVPALHAAAFEPDLFASVQFVRCLRSWVEVVGLPAGNQRVNVVHGALAAYDLPDLFNSVPAEKRNAVEWVDLPPETDRFIQPWKGDGQ